jgi:hypothetical protein
MRGKVVYAGIEIDPAAATRLEKRCDAAEILERKMPDSEYTLHPLPPARSTFSPNPLHQRADLFG